MSKTLEWCLEEVGIQLARRQPELAKFPLCHYDNKERRTVSRVVFRGQKKEQQADGPRAFHSILHVEFVTGKGTPVGQADSIMAGLDRAFGRDSLGNPSGLDALTNFEVLTPYEEGGDGTKENAEQHRMRLRTIPFIAKLAA